MYIKRDYYLNKLIEHSGNGMVKVITGIRRCGKSFLLFTIYHDYLISTGVREDHIITIALDDKKFVEYRDIDKLDRYIHSKITDTTDAFFILIDEVQYAIKREEVNNTETIGLYDMLNGLLRVRNVDVYVTGSNSRMLTKDVLTAFRGRGDEIRVNPLSFREYYDYVQGDKAETYEEFALYGGMPAVLLHKNPEDKRTYLKSLFDEIYFKDMCERYEIEKPEILDEMTDVLCSSVGSLTNVSKIAKTLNSSKHVRISANTVASYLEHLEESFLFSRAKRYDVKGKRYFSFPSKYYCTDIGLRNARLNMRQQEETHIMENIMYNELLSRGYAVDVGVVEITEADGKNNRRMKTLEIDFIINKGMHKYYVQSALRLDDEAKAKQERRPLMAVKDFFKKVIVSKTRMKPWMDDDGIIYIGLFDFLLDEDALNI